MKIILAEEKTSGGIQEEAPEQIFNQPTIRIGREAAGDGDIAFENKKYPMVSRRHAELRYENGNWIVLDAQSSYGTFLNRRKISAAEKITVGDRLQFGTNGPILRVVWFEIAPEDFSPPPPNPPEIEIRSAARAGENSHVSAPDAFRRDIPHLAASPAAPPINQKPLAESSPHLEFVGAPEKPLFKLEKQSVWLGRDAACDVRADVSAAMVSRRHAEIRRESGDFVVCDNNSFNGTLINGRRISAPTRLAHEDRIELGVGGPILRFVQPFAPPRPALDDQNFAADRLISAARLAGENEQSGAKTMVFQANSIASAAAKNQKAEPQLLMSVVFGGKNELTIGRAAGSDIRLDGLQISNRHARLVKTSSGVAVEDSGSTNGVFVGGERVARRLLGAGEAAQIGSFVIEIDGAGHALVFDTRAKTRLDAVNLTRDARTSARGKSVRLLDDVSLAIEPNEFVGILGASGAGKSTLMNALSGAEPASAGSVLINRLDLYRNFDALKQSVGYVPQDEILHRELSVWRTLFYVAKLRLSGDVSNAEIERIIEEVLDITGLVEQRNAAVKRLSGGQRKRVAVAVELMTKPSVIFLDEPTSGLDPATEEKIMRLFRQIAESGRTVVLTTHAMENVRLFDKIIVLMKGKLVFYGTPNEALEHFEATDFKTLYARLEEAVEQTSGALAADEWRRKFAETAQYRQYIAAPLAELGAIPAAVGGVQPQKRLGVGGAARQFATLARRYAEILFKDKTTLVLLLAQAPIIGFLIYLVTDAKQPRDFVYFSLSLVAVWFGTSIAAREIVREKPIFRRERMVNLGIAPYLASKIAVLGAIVVAQSVLLVVPLKLLDLIGAFSMPGAFLGVPQLWTVVLTAAVGVALGLLISALVKTSETATGLVPLILIPQLLFSGIVGVPQGASRVVGLAMPAAWSFDSMKRFSGLDTLAPEGSSPHGTTRGLGLYRSVEAENERLIVEAKKDLDAFKVSIDEKLQGLETDLLNGQATALPTLREPPNIKEAKKLPEDLSAYVAFLHPWMNRILNQSVLMLMFFILTLATLFALRLKDTR